jgi:hypothetical protein
LTVDEWAVWLAVLLVNSKVDETAENWAALMVSPWADHWELKSAAGSAEQ